MNEPLFTDNDLIRDQDRLVSLVVHAAGGRLTGRVRLQKVFYLLDKLGLESGFAYSYHHYGPYSEELSDAADFARAFGLIEEKFGRRNSDGARYSIFETGDEPQPLKKSHFNKDWVRSKMDLLAKKNATVLELAATAYWLRHEEKVADWRSEIVRRKGVKTKDGRLEEAEKLLKQLGLSLS